MVDNLKSKGQSTEVDVASEVSSFQEKVDSEPRRKSWNPFHRKHGGSSSKEEKHKEKRESMSDSGPFIVEMRNGVPITVENKNWPPGVNYKESSMSKQLRSVNGGLGDFYSDSAAIAPGGETAGNVGPDPDWIPGLSEEERNKLKKDKSGRYVF